MDVMLVTCYLLAPKLEGTFALESITALNLLGGGEKKDDLTSCTMFPWQPASVLQYCQNFHSRPASPVSAWVEE